MSLCNDMDVQCHEETCTEDAQRPQDVQCPEDHREGHDHDAAQDPLHFLMDDTMSRPRGRPRARSAESGRMPSPARLMWEVERWRDAFFDAKSQCEALQEELVTLHEAMADTEDGKQAHLRLMGRLAKENWRMGREISMLEQQADQPPEEAATQRSVRGRSRSPESPRFHDCRSQASSRASSPAASARGKRPAGVKRLNLGAFCTASISSQGTEPGSSPSEPSTPPSGSSEREEAINDELCELLEEGGDPNEPLEDGMLPLIAAVALNQEEAAVALLAAGADPNRSDKHGNLPIVEASYLRNEKIVQILLAAGADPAMRDADGLSANDILEAGNSIAEDELRQHAEDEVAPLAVC